jgi:hypothetical protein
MTARTAGGAWLRSAAERIRRALVPFCVALLGLGAAVGVAACGSAKPTVPDQPVSAPALLPPPKNSAPVGVDTTATTSTSTTGSLSSSAATAGTASSPGASGSASPSTGTGATVTPTTPSAGTGGGAAAAPGGTSGSTTTSPSTGGAGPGSAFCQQNPGAC